MQLIGCSVIMRTVHVQRITADMDTLLLGRSQPWPHVAVVNTATHLRGKDVREFWIPAERCIAIPKDQPLQLAPLIGEPLCED